MGLSLHGARGLRTWPASDGIALDSACGRLIPFETLEVCFEILESGWNGSVVRAFMFSFFAKWLYGHHTVVSDEVIRFVGLGKVKVAHDNDTSLS